MRIGEFYLHKLVRLWLIKLKQSQILDYKINMHSYLRLDEILV